MTHRESKKTQLTMKVKTAPMFSVHIFLLVDKFKFGLWDNYIAKIIKDGEIHAMPAVLLNTCNVKRFTQREISTKYSTLCTFALSIPLYIAIKMNSCYCSRLYSP